MFDEAKLIEKLRGYNLSIHKDYYQSKEKKLTKKN